MPLIEELTGVEGVVVWVIVACSAVALFIICEKVFHFHRAQIDVQEFLQGLYNVLRRNNAPEAISICEQTPGPVAHVLRSAILHADRKEEDLRKATEEATLQEVPRLEKRLKALATIAHVTPLLGLLGTVLGMIGAFRTMQAAGPFVSTADLAKDIWLALVTTAAGLVVAIPSYAFYNFLVGRVEDLILDMEKGASEMIYFLTHNRVDLPQRASNTAEQSQDSVSAGANNNTAQ